MKTLQKLVMMCTLFVGVLVMLMPQAALAAGTASDTDIINQATVSFDVGGSSTPFNINVPPSSGGDNDFIALSMGTTYREDNWSWTSRFEFRYAENEDKWGVATGIYGEPVSGIGLSAGVQIFKTDADSGANNTDADIRFGLAYRPKNTRWIVLDRLDLKFNEQESSNSNF
jgi:hypothetical protein